MIKCMMMGKNCMKEMDNLKMIMIIWNKNNILFQLSVKHSDFFIKFLAQINTV